MLSGIISGMFKRGGVMSKIDIMKVALDLANVLVDAGEEVETILDLPESQKLVSDVKQLIKDLKEA